MHRRLLKSLLWFGAIFILQFVCTQHAKAASTYPTAPETLTVTPGPASLTLGWNSPTDVATGILNYRVEYSLDGNSWTTSSSTIGASTFSYAITNLSVNTNYYIRVAAQVSSGLGPYAYPWTKLYGTNTAKRDGNSLITYQSGYGIGGTDTGTVLANSAFTRVRYKASANNSGSTVWADMNFAKWDTRTDTNFTTPRATIPYLRVPSTGGSEQFIIKTNVSDLTVNSSNSSLIGFGRQGRLEIWPFDYATGHTNLTPTGNDGTFDFDDTPFLNNAYGSFQVHDLTDTHTVFAWNNHASNTPEVGFGNSPSSNPDWTFTNNFSYGTNVFSLEIFANIPISTSFQGIGTVSINTISGSINKRTTKAITANTAGPGFVTFFYNGRKITNCVNVATVANVATCNWKPIITGQQGLSASFTSGDGSYTAANSTTLNATTKKR